MADDTIDHLHVSDVVPPRFGPEEGGQLYETVHNIVVMAAASTFFHNTVLFSICVDQEDEQEEVWWHDRT